MYFIGALIRILIHLLPFIGILIYYKKLRNWEGRSCCDIEVVRWWSWWRGRRKVDSYKRVSSNPEACSLWWDKRKFGFLLIHFIYFRGKRNIKKGKYDPEILGQLSLFCFVIFYECFWCTCCFEMEVMEVEKKFFFYIRYLVSVTKCFWGTNFFIYS